jgi:protein tyrosine phosphatase (PTP) superfamily phosphohydrolase (DUF442 family)
MNARNRLVVAACIAPIIAWAFVAQIAATAGTPATEDPLMAQLTGVANVCHPYPWLVTGGQPSADALEALAKAGIDDIFDLRGTGEQRGFDEPTVARSMRLHYLPIPTTAADLSDSRFTAFRHHLMAHGPDNPMFIHCGSGNRVGAVLLPWLVLDLGLSQNAALEMAHAVGLRDPELTKRALEYIRAYGWSRQ